MEKQEGQVGEVSPGLVGESSCSFGADSAFAMPANCLLRNTRLYGPHEVVAAGEHRAVVLSPIGPGPEAAQEAAEERDDAD